METYTPSQVLTTPSLVGSLMQYLPTVSPRPPHPFSPSSAGAAHPQPRPRLLLLQISAAADYFTSNASLMMHPPQVDVDIILDPFLFNVLPRSLVPTIGWIVVVALAGWAISKRVVSFLVRQVVLASDETEEGKASNEEDMEEEEREKETESKKRR